MNSCSTCEQQAVSDGLCDPNLGCEHVSGDADRALCDALFSCMLSSHCAVNDPIDCLCGDAKGASCFTGANGACREQVMAATKQTEVVEAGKRFYDMAFPSGFATQRVACWFDFCAATAPPPNTNACTL